MLIILSAGPLSVIQDLGRKGYQHLGVSPGGPMDEHAFSWANRLLDNPINTPCVEITIGMFRAQFTHETTFALTGAQMAGTLNGKKIAPWQSYHAYANDTLELRGASSGTRAYLAVKGGFCVPNILGSSATVMRDELGGLTTKGEALKANDCLPYPNTPLMMRRQTPPQFIPAYSPKVTLDLIASYQFDWFTKAQHQRFFDSEYTLTPHCDRMGFRLSGTPIVCHQQRLISEGTALGAVQIPADGQPIILMRDRQTIGGYPKLGCLSAQSVNQLAQSQPGTHITFRLISLENAIEQQRQEQRFFQHYVG
ncbi:biotin-dependent carboxyltransferase family protein [Vibrio palustris]|uniref:KipI antagonist n=1 Tax=Vibrio palustris TaxID=1918946 RepID=A0A1R4B0Y3_9VIBR|nr:biotin-dependent carboxyltransferase family protein [Vibrio palustris]SJL82586.1 KipI antagonist [Vibrio palustris]